MATLQPLLQMMFLIMTYYLLDFRASHSASLVIGMGLTICEERYFLRLFVFYKPKNRQ